MTPENNEEPKNTVDIKLDDLLSGGSDNNTKSAEVAPENKDIDAEKQKAAIEELKQKRLKAEAENRISNVMYGASTYSATKNDKGAWQSYQNRLQDAQMSKANSVSEMTQIEKENNLHWINNGYQHFTQEDWQKFNNSSTTFEKAKDGFIGFQKETAKRAQAWKDRLSDPESSDAIFQNTISDLKSGSSLNRGIGEGKRISSPEDLVRGWKEFYNAVFDKSKSQGWFNPEYASNKEVLEKMQGVALAALQSGDAKTAGTILAFLEAADEVPKELLEKAAEERKKWDEGKIKEFTDTVQSERKMQRDYKQELATQSKQPIYR